VSKFLRKLLPLLVLFAMAGVRPARAQFIGYVANQGVNQNVFTNADCSVTLTSGSLNNIGQVGHAVSYTVTSGGPNVQPAIQGSADGATYFQISNNAPSQPGIISGVGTYAFLRVRVTGGGAGCRITANYTGSTVATTVNLTGSNAQFMYQFNPFVAAAAGTTANSANLTPPYGDASGYLVVSYAATGPSGSTLAVNAIDGPTGTTNTVATFTLANTAATAQVFPLPRYAAGSLFLTYTAGGASATTFTVSYYFTYPGQGPLATQLVSGSVTIAGQPVSVIFPSPQPVTGTFTQSSTDPCQSSAILKSSAPIPLTTSPTTVTIVPLVSGKAIFVCAVNLAIGNGTAPITTLEYGTGSNCAGGTTALTGGYVVTNSGSQDAVINIAGPGTVFAIPASNGLCVAITGSGTPSTTGLVTFVQQ
jgi:hypothetical protein